MNKLYSIFLLVLVATQPALAQQPPAVSDFKLSTTMRFEENKGQVANTEGEVQNDILFTLKDKGMNVYFRKDGLSYQWHYTEELMDGPYAISEATGLPMNENEEKNLPDKFKEPKPTRLHTYRVDMQWLGSNKNVQVVSEQPFEDYNNYYHAHCPDGITNVKSYAKLTFKDMYPGIDVQYYIKDGHLKYDVLVAEGADISPVQFTYEGATPQLIDGKLRLETTGGFLEEQQPIAWGDKGDLISVKYCQVGDNVGFNLGVGGGESAFVIDPVLIWATYYGGTNTDNSRSIFVDGGGSYLAGYTNSTTSIATGGHQNTIASSQDAFLVKFDASGVRQWGTYYGGSGADFCFSGAVDGSSNIYIAGNTSSSTSIAIGGHQNTIGGGPDAFLVKFNASGARQWGTYYGGTGNDQGSSVAVDGTGNVYLAGQAQSSTGIANGGHQNTIASTQDGYLVKFNTSGVRQWGTYYGGTGADYIGSVATDGLGNIYLAGATNSATAIASGGHQNTIGGGLDAFLVKFSTSGARQWGTYYGGGTVSENDYGESVAADGSGNVYLSGQTQLTTGIASGGHQNTYGGGVDAFLVKFNASGVRQWGTYLGGTGGEVGQSVVADASGNIYLAGHTNSGTAISSNGHQNTFGGGVYDAFVVKFNASGLRQWGTYYGGTSTDYGYSVAVDDSEIIYLAGETDSETAIASGGHMNTIGGGLDSFLVKMGSGLATEPTAQPTALNFTSVASSSFTVNYTAATGTPVGYIAVRKSGSAPTSDPVDGTAYTVGTSLGDGSIAYVGNAASFSQTGLAASTTYHYKIYSYNGSGATINYRQTTPLAGSQATTAALAAEPTAQPTALSFASVTSSSFTVNYTAATGTPAGYIAVRRTGAAPTSDPVDGTAYTLNATFGDGIIAYVGTAATFNETGLSSSTTYHYKIYSYNGSAATINYRIVSPLTGSQATSTTLATEPIAQPTALNFTSVTSSSFTINYTAASGAPAGYIAVRRVNATPTSDPIDGTAYTVGANLGDGVIAYVGSAATFNQTSLAAGTTYHYKIYSYNGSGATINYRITSPLTGNQLTLEALASEPSAQPTALSFTSVTVTSFTVNFTGATGSPAGYIAVRRTGAGPTSDPVDGTAYTVGTSLGDGAIAYVGNAASFSQTGLAASTTYHYKIYSFNGSAATINYRQTTPLSGNQATAAAGADTSAPQVGSNTTPTQVAAGSTVNVSLALSDAESGISSARISYGPATSSTYTATNVDMTNTAGTFSFTIPASAQSELGIRYRIVVTNGASLTTTVGPVNVAVQVTGTGTSIPYTAFGSAVSNYRIIAIPLNLSNKTVNSVLGDNLGSYGDQEKWRMFRYSGGQTTELSGTSSLEPGRGYWFIAAQSATLDSGPGQSTGSADNPATLSITPGWNQIGNPYRFNLAWNDVVSANTSLGLGNLRVFRTNSFSNATSLNSFEGGFVFAGEGGTLSYPAIKNASVNSRSKEEEILRYNSIDSDDWEIRFTLLAATTVNELSGIGMHPLAQEGFDSFDDFILPVFLQSPELKHKKVLHGSHYSRDIVPSADEHEWNFSVTSPDKNPLTLRWENKHLQEATKKLWLVDLVNNNVIDMSLSSSYYFTAPREFRAIYTAGTVELPTSANGLILYDPYPNPVENLLMIPFYTAHNKERVTISLVSQVGIAVEEITSAPYDAGFHTLEWHISDTKRKTLTGLYFIRITTDKGTLTKKIILH